MPSQPLLPLDEAARIEALTDLLVMDSPPEPLFDLMTRFAAQLCGTPIALISLIDEERQWFKANVGLPGVNETPRDVAFCAHAIQSDNLFEVPNATLDPRFADNPLVEGKPDIRFYAGAPLVLPGGARAGTLCVIDRTPGHLGEREAGMLRTLADMVVEALVMRRDLIRRSLSVRSDFEAALAQSEARYRALVEEQRELVALVRDSGEIVYANPAWIRFFGVQAARATGANVFSFMDQDDEAAVRGAFEHVLLTGENVVCETRSTCPDGVERWVAWSNNRQSERGHEGWLLRLVGTDVTQRKRAEVALRESEAFLDRTGRIARVGGWQADLSTATMRLSDETCRILDVELGHRLKLADAMGFVAEGDRALAEEAIRRSVSEGRSWDLELRLTTAKGKELWVRLVGDAEREAGRVVRLAGAVQDITERRTSKAELLREQTLRLQIESHAHALAQLLREREEMTQVLAHEVRQPLNNASAALQSAAAVLSDVGEQAASVRLGRAQAVMGQVLASIDNTLAAASLLARQHAADGADTDIDTLVAVVLADIPAGTRDRIRVERIATSRTVSADMSLLRLALRNLLLNALAYSASDTPVVLRLIDSDDPLALVIEVEDRGPGFSAELVGRLFERGNRGKHPSGTPGHGLGLYIVRRVMELHGGRVELLRNTPRGSTMRLIVEQSLGD